MRLHRSVSLLLILFAFVAPGPAQDSAATLANILANKVIIGPSELAMVQAADPQARVQLLASILEEKGGLSRAEIARLKPFPDSPEPAQFIRAAAKPPDTGPQAASNPKPGPESAPPVTSQNRFPVTICGTL